MDGWVDLQDKPPVPLPSVAATDLPFEMTELRAGLARFVGQRFDLVEGQKIRLGEKKPARTVMASMVFSDAIKTVAACAYPDCA